LIVISNGAQAMPSPSPHRGPGSPGNAVDKPIRPHPPTLDSPSKSAAGVKGFTESLRYAWGRGGVVKGTRGLLKMNQLDGFDCQSCAWPSPDEDRHTFELCESGAKAVGDELMPARVDQEFFARHSVRDLLAHSDRWLNAQGRLAHPMIRRAGASHFTPVSWDEAFAVIAQELNGLSSPWEASFYTSGRTSNEAAFLYGLFARQFGCNNLPDCSNMCHESTSKALGDMIGLGKGTVKLQDFHRAGVIYLMGQNPGTNHPRMLTWLERATEHGVKIVAVNPLRELGNSRFKNPQDFKHPRHLLPTLVGRGTRIADLHVPIRIGGDAAFLTGMMKHLLAEEERHPGEVLDHEFLRLHTVGFEAFRARLDAISWDDVTARAGVGRALIEQAAQHAVTGRQRGVITCWSMGLTQHEDSVATIQEIVHFHLLGGHIGRSGAGLCPVRGHSNVQGDRTVGIWEKMPEKFHERLGREFGFESPRRHGSDTVQTIQGMHAGRIKVFFAMGGNFLQAPPDTAYTAEALQRCRLTAHVATKLNRAHLVTGQTGLILPCLGRTEIDRQAGGEQFVTTEDSMGIINPSRGFTPPVSPHLLSECMIVARLAEATLGSRTTVPWRELVADYNRIRERLERVVTDFQGFNERVQRNEVFHLPNAPHERRFETDDGRVHFQLNELPDSSVPPGRYRLMTIRAHDQFNTTIYGLDDRYRGVYNGRRVLFMAHDDVIAAGLQAGEFVDLTSHFPDRPRHARHFMVTPYDLPRGCVACYYPEGNVLMSIEATAKGSNCPTYKSAIVSVTRSSDHEAALAGLRQEIKDT
jgi:molybdopterin-dependent oxidoreductase alpha subunit